MVSVQECGGNASVLESSFARGDRKQTFLNQCVFVVSTLDMQEVMDPALAVEL